MIEEEVTDIVVQQPPDHAAVQRQQPQETVTVIGVSNLPGHVQQLLIKKARFKEFNNRDKNRRLHKALMSKFDGN
jgi:hypothetical protein